MGVAYWLICRPRVRPLHLPASLLAHLPSPHFFFSPCVTCLHHLPFLTFIISDHLLPTPTDHHSILSSLSPLHHHHPLTTSNTSCHHQLHFTSFSRGLLNTSKKFLGQPLTSALQVTHLLKGSSPPLTIPLIAQ